MNTEELRRVEAQVEPVKVKALALKIEDAQGYEDGTAMLIEIKKAQTIVSQTFDGAISAAHKAHKEIVALKKRFTDPIEFAERSIKTKIANYRAEQQRIAAAREAQLQAEARKRAEDEQLALAEALQRDGQKDEAEMVLQEPTNVPVVIVQPDIPQVDGVSSRKVWKFRVVDPMKIPREFLKIDEVKLGAMARAMKELAKVEGVVFYSEDSISARSGV